MLFECKDGRWKAQREEDIFRVEFSFERQFKSLDFQVYGRYCNPLARVYGE